MNTNPFAPPPPIPPIAPPTNSGADTPASPIPHQPPPEVPSSEWRFGCSPGACWLRKTCVTVLAVIALFSLVTLEVKHSKDLYRMSRLVAQADEDRRQCLERQRLGEAREARLQAAYLRQAAALASVQLAKSDTRRQGWRTPQIHLASR